MRSIQTINNSRETFLRNIVDSLSMSDLLNILIASGVKNRKTKELSERILSKYGKRLLDVTYEELIKEKWIEKSKALKIIAAITLVKKLYGEQGKYRKDKYSYISEGIHQPLLNIIDSEAYTIDNKATAKIKKKANMFQLQNRRFLGNKYKLLGFIEDIVKEKCNGFQSLCDIFSGTGVVGARFNKDETKIISNDFLYSNYIPLKTFLGVTKINSGLLEEKINILNMTKADSDNYFSIHFGGSYFTKENAKKIGAVREKIEDIAESEDEKAVLLTSLIYAVDRIANTVGHYDAFRKKLDTVQPLQLLIPDVPYENNKNNDIYKEDANDLIRKINFDVLYIDPPYNSRQYCDAYHLLENLARWEKPLVYGKAKKMDRVKLKSKYCMQTASMALADLITNARCKHILLSYNNTGESKDGRSNARIKDKEIISILKRKGEVEIFERDYKAFTTGKSNTNGHAERIFYCKVSA